MTRHRFFQAGESRRTALFRKIPLFGFWKPFRVLARVVELHACNLPFGARRMNVVDRLPRHWTHARYGQPEQSTPDAFTSWTLCVTRFAGAAASLDGYLELGLRAFPRDGGTVADGSLADETPHILPPCLFRGRAVNSFSPGGHPQ